MGWCHRHCSGRWWWTRYAGCPLMGLRMALSSMIYHHWQSCRSIRRSEAQAGLSQMRWCHCHCLHRLYWVHCWSCRYTGMPSQSVAYNCVVRRTGFSLGWLEGGCVAGGGIASNKYWVLNLSCNVIVGSLLLVCILLLLGVLSLHHRGRQGTRCLRCVA